MRALKFRASRKSLEQIYISFIRPLLEYCDSVWDNFSTEAKKQLEAIHIEAARTITGATKLCSICSTGLLTCINYLNLFNWSLELY